MSPEDMEKLRRLEEEVDRERDAAKKRREELEAKKALVVPEEKPAEAQLPAKKEEASSALVTEADANAWKRGLQKKVVVGAAGVMVTYWLMSNIITIAAMGAVVGAVWHFSGKYLNPPDGDSSGKKKKDSDAE